jgi:trehalose synthase
MTNLRPEESLLGLHSLEDYQSLIGAAAVERIQEKLDRLPPLRITNISSTYYGGGVSEILSPLTLLLNSAGLKTGWRILQGTPEFFAFTKEIHNGLQGADVALTPEKMRCYEQVVSENAARMHLEDHDIIIVHDPQPLPMALHCRGKLACVWQCHIDLTTPNAALWRYLSGFIERFDTAVLSLPEYSQPLQIPQRFIMPAINPFSIKNREMSDREIRDCLSRYKIPTDIPLIVQVSRFDRWKDPQGVIDAFRIARKQVDCALVLVGNRADDDPEGQRLFEAIYRSAGEDIIIVLAEDAALVNALQRSAAVVLQKSLREGFGLTVAEAMWKGACVVGGNVGGIRHQITDGKDGFLVDDTVQAAERIIQLLTNEGLRRRLSLRARKTVADRFLMSRLAEDWIDLIGSLVSDNTRGGADRCVSLS